MLFDLIDVCYEKITDVLNTCGIHTVMLGSTSRRHSVCQRQPSVLFLTALNRHSLQRHTVTEEIDPIAPALHWQYAFTAFHCFHERVFISGRNNIPCACSVKENSPRNFPRERNPSKIH